MNGLEVRQVVGWFLLLACFGLMVWTAHREIRRKPIPLADTFAAIRMSRCMRSKPIPLADTLAAIAALQRKMDEENWTEEQRLRVYAVMFGVEGPQRRK